MSRARVITVPLGASLVMVAAILGWAAVLRLGPWSYDAVLAELRDGDLERTERLRLLRRVVEAGLVAPAEDPGAGLRVLCGAMAAVALDDAAALASPAFRSCLGHDREPPRLSPEQAAVVAGVDPALATLGSAMAAETAGDRAAARLRYAQAEASSRQFHLRLAGELARAGLARLQ